MSFHLLNSDIFLEGIFSEIACVHVLPLYNLERIDNT
jgi:hypothetical protein